MGLIKVLFKGIEQVVKIAIARYEINV